MPLYAATPALSFQFSSDVLSVSLVCEEELGESFLPSKTACGQVILRYLLLPAVAKSRLTLTTPGRPPLKPNRV